MRDNGRMKTLHVVAAVLRDGSGRVFAARRAPGRSSAGLWEFPGGKVEPGESAAQALEREIAEELGCAITAGSRLDRSTTIVGELAIDLECLHATLIGAPPTHSTDHDELGWFSPADLRALPWCEPDLPAVARLIA